MHAHKHMRITLRRFWRRLRRLIWNPVFLALTLIGNTVTIVGATAFYLAERGINPHVSSLFDCVWWSVSTVTTVGYGDVVPVTPLGRAFGIGLMIVGTALFCCYTALFAETLIRDDIFDFENELRSLGRRVRELAQNENADTEEIRALLLELEAQLARRSAGPGPRPKAS